MLTLTEQEAKSLQSGAIGSSLALSFASLCGGAFLDQLGTVLFSPSRAPSGVITILGFLGIVTTAFLIVYFVGRFRQRGILDQIRRETIQPSESEGSV